MLGSADLDRIVFANRSIDRAQTLANEFQNGTAIALEELAPTLDEVDVLLTSTGAQSLMVDQAELAGLDPRRDVPVVPVGPGKRYTPPMPFDGALLEALRPLLRERVFAFNAAFPLPE